MNTQNNRSESDISAAAIDAVIRQARDERAQAMRAAAVEFPALLKRLLSGFRPIRARTPHKGVWA
jgi:hypothetical protein